MAHEFHARWVSIVSGTKPNLACDGAGIVMAAPGPLVRAPQSLGTRRTRVARLP
jgi:hypothetical protein